MATVEVERRAAVVIVTLNRPEVHNCIDPGTAGLLAAAIESFAADDDARVLVVTGAGGAAFSSGADLRALDGLLRRPGVERTGPLGFARLDSGKPTIAAVEGHCYAGGLELACWCDIRIAGAGARFGVLNRRWGVPLVDGGTVRLPRIVGQGNALYLIETGARIGAERAAAMGLVQEVVERGRALERALELADLIAASPWPGVVADRAGALAAWDLPSVEALEAEGKRGSAAAGEEMAAGLRRFSDGERPEPPEKEAAREPRDPQ
ncbi:MAG TPA: enoyl-CoA hydratase-related protein [Actinomycetota bacterium]